MKKKQKSNKTKDKRNIQHLNRLAHEEIEKKQKAQEELKNIPDITPQITDYDNTLLEKFETELGSEDSLKPLLTIKDIKLKTDLHEDQISLLTRIIAISNTLKRNGEQEASKILDDVVSEFVTLSVSKERKGRTEYVDAHGRKMENMKFQPGNTPFGQQGNPQQGNIR
jgi:hypothetical protein